MQEEFLQFKVSFDDEKIKKCGLEKNNIYYTVKIHFMARGLKFVPDDNFLIFENTGRSTDYGHMWAVICALLRCDWFVDTISSCVFLEDGIVSDIAERLPRLKEIMKITL